MFFNFLKRAFQQHCVILFVVIVVVVVVAAAARGRSVRKAAPGAERPRGKRGRGGAKKNRCGGAVSVFVFFAPSLWGTPRLEKPLLHIVGGYSRHNEHLIVVMIAAH